MADFTALKTAIQNAIKQNGNEEITGNILQDVLLAIVSTLGDGSINDLITALGTEATTRSQADGTLQQNINAEAQARQLADSTLQEGINTVSAAITAINNAIGNGCVYAGIATPSSTPASGKVFYLALTAGTYTNYGGLEVSQGINILKNNGSTWSLDSFLGIDDAPTPSSNKLVKSDGVFNDIMTNGSAFDLTAYNNGTTYADLNAAITALNALPAAYKKGGMSMKYVQSSDNKYYQFRYMPDDATTVATFTNVANWQGVDTHPTIGSENLTKSVGVSYNLNRKIDDIPTNNLLNLKYATKGVYFKTDGRIAAGSSGFGITDYIPVNEQNIVANADKATNRGAFNVYDANFNYLRTIIGNDTDVQKYTYQSGDAYVRICFQSISSGKIANYGDTLLEYEPYKNTIEKEIDDLEKLFIVDFEGSRNIIDPSGVTYGKYINGSGGISNASSENYGVTDFIPVNDDISIHGTVSSSSSIFSFVVYNSEKEKVYVAPNGETSHYTYDSSRGDAYIRLGVRTTTMISEDYPTLFANYGSTLLEYDAYVEPHSDVISMQEEHDERREYELQNNANINQLSVEINELKNEERKIDFSEVAKVVPSKLYAVWNSLRTNRNYHNNVYIDHLVYNIGDKEDCDLGFRKESVKSYPIIGYYNNIDPSDSSSKNVVEISETVNLVSGEYNHPVSFTKCITKNTVGANAKPRLLCIGDSVTTGQGADYQKKEGMPKQYWSWVSWLFAQDKKDNNGVGYDFVSVGTNSALNDIFGATDSFVVDGVTYNTFATGKGGLAIEDLNLASMGDDPQTEEIEGSGVNPFYDPSLQRFSFAYFLEQFRTMDDNGNRLYFDTNQSTTGTAGSGNIGYLEDGSIAVDGNGNTLYIGVQISNTELMNVCRPTHVVINLNHNSTYDNYVSVLPDIISDIRTNVPDVYVILMNIDSTGCYAPSLYPEVIYNAAKLNKGLHNKNCKIYGYQQTLESAQNKIYVCSGNLVQHPIDVLRGVFSGDAENLGVESENIDGVSPTYPFSGMSYHPNNLAHRSWGYQLYALIKYTLSL